MLTLPLFVYFHTLTHSEVFFMITSQSWDVCNPLSSLHAEFLCFSVSWHCVLRTTNTEAMFTAEPGFSELQPVLGNDESKPQPWCFCCEMLPVTTLWRNSFLKDLWCGRWCHACVSCLLPFEEALWLCQSGSIQECYEILSEDISLI